MDTCVIQGSSELMVNLPKRHGTHPHSSKRRSEDNIEDNNSRQKTEMIQYFRKYTVFIIFRPGAMSEKRVVKLLSCPVTRLERVTPVAAGHTAYTTDN